MDPNANLEAQAELLRKIALLNPCTEKRRLQRELRTLRLALTEWLAKGGFEPDWANYPATNKYFGVVVVGGFSRGSKMKLTCRP